MPSRPRSSQPYIRWICASRRYASWTPRARTRKSPPRSARRRAALAARGVQRGWWWTRIVDLNYGQLLGYQGLAWTAQDGPDTKEPRITVATEPAWLHPIVVVRNADGQGTALPMPDEMWG
jgi:hypothetical protein